MTCLIIDESAYKALNILNASNPSKRFRQVTPVQLEDGSWALNADILEPVKGEKSDKTFSHYFDFLNSLPKRDVKSNEFIQNREDLQPGDIKPIPSDVAGI